MRRDDPIRLRVEVDRRPEPALLRAAIQARLRGQPAPEPERRIGDAVAAAVARARAERGGGR